MGPTYPARADWTTRIRNAAMHIKGSNAQRSGAYVPQPAVDTALNCGMATVPKRIAKIRNPTELSTTHAIK